MAIFNFINENIFSHVLRFFMTIFNGNFAAAIFMFTLIINLALIPLTVKSQKSSMQQLKIKPKLDAIKEKYGDDKQKYNAAMQELYAREKVSMSGGCLPMILRLVLLMSIYYLVLSPIVYLANVDSETIKAAAKELGNIKIDGNLRLELDVISAIKAEGPAAGSNAAKIFSAVKGMDFNFFGIDLLSKPQFALNLEAVRLNWIIPFLSFAAAMFGSILSIRTQKKANPGGPNMTGMMLFMPVISLIIAFSAPCGLGFYWACSSFISAIIQEGVQYYYGPAKLLAKERAKGLIGRYEVEKKSIDSVKE